VNGRGPWGAIMLHDLSEAFEAVRWQAPSGQDYTVSCAPSAATGRPLVELRALSYRSEKGKKLHTWRHEFSLVDGRGPWLAEAPGSGAIGPTFDGNVWVPLGRVVDVEAIHRKRLVRIILPPLIVATTPAAKDGKGVLLLCASGGTALFVAPNWDAARSRWVPYVTPRGIER
jgi:hypothetical protein